MHISLGLKYSMAQSPDNEDFMEELRKYECLYNRFRKKYKDKYKKISAWIATKEKKYLF